ncbi:MAG: antibiotic biosynthesis monooxygenase [Saprospiraceae bacterium]|nr:MAG: antibiotic biosynthesis monooxygenase [Saprospiraceae bacterium]
MIKRIVKMTFREDEVPAFHAIFEEVKPKIQALDGCLHLELLQDVGNPAVLFTFSIWENETALDAYRQSALFSATWKRTKALFAAKAEAWSVQVVGDFRRENTVR